LSIKRINGKAFHPMDQHSPTSTPPPGIAAPTREERLAAKLRENLRRRKAQARALDGDQSRSSQTEAEKLGADASK